MKLIEQFLKIDVKENFVDWIADEIALLQIQSDISKGKNDLALVLKANDADDAKSNLDFVLKQIKKKTPVKFKAVDYKGYKIINYGASVFKPQKIKLYSFNNRNRL